MAHKEIINQVVEPLLFIGDILLNFRAFRQLSLVILNEVKNLAKRIFFNIQKLRFLDPSSDLRRPQDDAQRQLEAEEYFVKAKRQNLNEARSKKQEVRREYKIHCQDKIPIRALAGNVKTIVIGKTKVKTALTESI